MKWVYMVFERVVIWMGFRILMFVVLFVMEGVDFVSWLFLVRMKYIGCLLKVFFSWLFVLFRIKLLE